MKAFVVVCLFAVVAVAVARPNESKYTDRYDNVNLDEILANRRLLMPYVECLLGKGKCAPDAKELKGHIQEALENECGKCTEAQKSGTEKVIGYFINNDSENWKQLSAKYDPENKYSKKYEDRLHKLKA